MSSNICLSPRQHHRHRIYRPQVQVIDDHLYVIYLYSYLNHFCNFVEMNQQRHVILIFCVYHYSFVFIFLLFLALCAPLEISPSMLQCHIQHLKLEPDDYIIQKVLFCCLPPIQFYSTCPLVVWLNCPFCLPSQIVMLKTVGEESLYWRCSLKEEVNWWFDLSARMVSTKDQRVGDLCTVSPSSGSLRSGQSICLDVSIRPNAFRKGKKVWIISILLS